MGTPLVLMADKLLPFPLEQSGIRVTMILQHFSVLFAAMVQGRRCKFQSSGKHNTYRLAGDVNGTEQVCAYTQCCLGYFLLSDGHLKVDLLACSHKGYCPNTDCEASAVFDKRLIKCVCSTDFCNSNITWKPQLLEASFSDIDFTDTVNSSAFLLPTAILIVCVLVVVVMWRQLFKETNVNTQTTLLGDSIKLLHSCHTLDTTQIDSNNVGLQQIVGSGHFATVWQGKYHDSVVAVKVFSAGCEHKFALEKEVYELPLMKHAGIVPFLGAGRNAKHGQCFIVLEYATNGSLNSFLSGNASNWISSLKLAQSLAQGLAYLHDDLKINGLHKPTVAHRDLSSNNVLVRADNTCVLSDFGCSTILRSAGYRNLQPQAGAMQGHANMGTLRYMSPEVLEGSVNLRNVGWLKQSDVYALGLLLWEIWMRCSGLFEGSLVPDHQLPYEAELGSHLTLEGLILNVSKMNMRPSIPTSWKQKRQGYALQELVTDCWDHDPDARLTAQCVVERLHSL